MVGTFLLVPGSTDLIPGQEAGIPHVYVYVCVLSHVQIFVTPCTVAHQAPLSMGVSRQEYWSGLLYPPPGALPEPGIEPTSPVSPALQGGYTLYPLSDLESPFMCISPAYSTEQGPDQALSKCFLYEGMEQRKNLSKFS